jgi:hypothetical protein
MKWINVLGMTLQFVSFWFAAPEILGEEKLKHYEDKIKYYISNLPTLLFGVPAIVLIGILLSSSEADKGEIPAPLIFVILAIVFRSKLKARFEAKLIQPLLDRLIESEDKRQDYLRLAAIFFTSGFLMSVIATILN